ncbi:MAG: nucleoside phosphorylase [Lachnospiraceae bacterium]|nr:nucleoside phosphorylase [Lachnospiraceae bacterium]
MLSKNEYPILEYDDAKTAKLNPDSFKPGKFKTNKMVITFFPEVMKKLITEERLSLDTIIPGENPVEIYRFNDDPGVLITLGQVGCPACAGNLDLFNEMGVNKVMFCGGGGVLDRNIEVGQLLLVEGAIRDEGFSYHYLPPSRVVYTDKGTTGRIAKYLDENNVPYMRGLTWTTDAIFRETSDKIESRKAEGGRIVEMEQAGCIAVACFRGFEYGALIYGGDDLSGEEWSERGWRSREGIRYDLVNLCKKLVYII